jgi:hypothetical protein
MTSLTAWDWLNHQPSDLHLAEQMLVPNAERVKMHPRYQPTRAATGLEGFPPQPPAKRKKKRPKAAVLPKPKPVVTEIHLPDDVSVLQLSQLLEVSVEEVEASLAQFGETSSSDKDVISPGNAELVSMAFGKSVIFSQAVLVSLRGGT